MQIDSHTERYIIDRIEEGLAHLEAEGGPWLLIPSSWLPPGAVDGHVVTVKREAAEDDPILMLTVTLDSQATIKRLEQARELRSSLKRGPEGDIEL